MIWKHLYALSVVFSLQLSNVQPENITASLSPDFCSNKMAPLDLILVNVESRKVKPFDINLIAPQLNSSLSNKKSEESISTMPANVIVKFDKNKND